MKIETARLLKIGDRVRWMPEPPDEGTVVTSDYTGVSVRWDNGQQSVLDFSDRRWACIEPEAKANRTSRESEHELV
jgi:hypothetical protein